MKKILQVIFVCTLIVVVLLTISMNASAAPNEIIKMVKDINFNGIGSDPIHLTAVGDKLYFKANGGLEGSEPWISNGTEAGTQLLKDICPGAGYTSRSDWYTAVGTTLFFSANDGIHGNELWKSNGTASGTVMVKNIYIDTPSYIGSSSPYFLTAVGNTLYFRASDELNNYELWKSNGTSEGTIMVKDINPGGSSYVNEITPFGNEFFFSANNGINGTELWKSNGTAAGTVMVKDIYPGTKTSHITWLTVVGDLLFFRATDGINGVELWKSNGTAAGTIMVKNINPDTSDYNYAPSSFTAFGDTLYFSAYNETTGYELWKSNGTAAGTIMVKDICPGSVGSYPSFLTVVGDTLFFRANNETTGYELWKSNGTAAGTVLVKDIYPGVSSSNPSSLTAITDTLFFSADDGVNGNELWKSNGTAIGTIMVKDIYTGVDSSNPSSLTNVSNTLFFSAEDRSNGVELWKSNGTIEGTKLVKNINPQTDSSDPYSLTAMDGNLFFTADDNVNNFELWKSDRTDSGTIMIKEIYPGPSGPYGPQPAGLTAMDGELFFQADNNINGSELWKSNGTTGGTTMVKDIYPGSSGSQPSGLTVMGDTLFFAASDGVNGSELWKSDGTKEGTVLVKDIRPGTSSSYPSRLIVVGDTLFFSAVDEINGSELHKSDGTKEGTVLVRDIYPGFDYYTPNNLIAFDDKCFFVGYDGVNGSELWMSDGTKEGTVMVRDIYPGSSGSTPSGLTVMGDTLFFEAYDSVNGSELWMSDGTKKGTVLVKDIRPGSSDSSPSGLTALGDTLFFSANNGVNGSELWRSNGTAAGTVQVKDINPGFESSSPNYLTAFGDTLFFSANDGINGTELWRSNGIAAGTVMVEDIIPDGGSSYPTLLTIADNTIFFRATDGIHGYELWSLFCPVHNVDKDSYHGCIQEGIDNANPGDTLEVKAGTYYENIQVDKMINLVGEDEHSTIIDGGGSGDAVYVIADWVNISNFTIRNSSSNTGIYVWNSMNNHITNCTVYNNDKGIILSYSTDNKITNCTIYNNTNYGINLGNSESNDITSCIIYNNSYGIYAPFSLENTITNSVLYKNNYGISLASSSNNDVIDCIIYNNTIYGIRFWDSSNNNIYHNNFFNNTQNAYDSRSNTWDNGYPSGGNYWDDYTGIDANGDGIGDTSYYISGGSSRDRYPLINFYGSVKNLETGEEFISIQDAIDDSDTHAGHTIFVKNGVYYENIVVNKAINLVGNSMSSTIIDGGGSGNVFYIIASWVNISNFTIRNTLGHSGVYIYNSDNSTISNCKIYDTYFGLRLVSAENNTMTKCTVHNNSYGVYLHSFSNNIIYHNSFFNNTQNAYDNSRNTWDNGYPSGGNYWDDYTGIDANGDGIGDTSYNILGGSNWDRYPLMSPWNGTSVGLQADFYVDDDAPSHWYDATHVKTIQEGIYNAVAGDTVFVLSGIYYENVYVNKAINLVGINKNTTIIDTGGIGDVVRIIVSWVNISNFTIRNGRCGIYLHTSSDINITDCISYNNTLYGIGLWYSPNNNITNCTIYNNTHIGIYLGISSYNHITNCIVYNNTNMGMGLASSSYNNITNCTVSNHSNLDKMGIFLHSSNQNEIFDNLIINNYYGAYLINSSRTQVEDNEFDNNIQAIEDPNSNYNTYKGNLIHHNEYGITITDSQHNTFVNNQIIQNSYGIIINENSNGNEIYYNNFIENIVQAQDEGSNTWDDGEGIGNFWSDYTGEDTDGDGIGDTSYQELDQYPIMEPPSNAPPIADADGPYISLENNQIIFNASNSFDYNDDDVLQYRWDFDSNGTWDTIYSTDPTAFYSWNDDYSGLVTLEIYDGEYTDTAIATITVNNVAPTITILNGTLDPVSLGSSIYIDGEFTDPGVFDTHNATINWGDDNVTDLGNVTSPIPQQTHTYTEAGVYTIMLTVTDDDGGIDNEIFQYAVVYEQDGGFVTGGGWIDSPLGAYTPDPNLTGKANFGFVSKYQKGQQKPTGNTEFQFHAVDMNFHSQEYDWLVVTHHKAMYKGNGTINGDGNYGFILSAIDEKLTPSTDVDLFRIKIWDKINNDTIIYDNELGEEEDTDPITQISGGQIVIRKD